MSKPRVSLLVNSAKLTGIFEPDVISTLQEETELVRLPAGTALTAETAVTALKDCTACITSWGTPKFTPEMLAAAPNLRLIVHAAGSVKPVVGDEVYAKGIIVTSGAPAIARGVAETALGFIIMAMKNVFELSSLTKEKGWAAGVAAKTRVKEMLGTTVGVVGAGHVGRYVMKLLRNFDVQVLLYDPTLTPADAQAHGAKLVDLETLLQESDVISLHAPSIPATKHMINADRLKMMKDGATLINTARGSLIDEAALAQELATGRIRACLDVTDPEPPAPDNPLRTMPNVIMTPHIAGVVSTGLHWLGRYALDEIRRFTKGTPPFNPVSQEQLKYLA